MQYELPPSGWNLPPGVRESDIPGNRPEDIRWEQANSRVEDALLEMEKRGDMGAEIARRILKYGSVSIENLIEWQIDEVKP